MLCTGPGCPLSYFSIWSVINFNFPTHRSVTCIHGCIPSSRTKPFCYLQEPGHKCCGSIPGQLSQLTININRHLHLAGWTWVLGIFFSYHWGLCYALDVKHYSRTHVPTLLRSDWVVRTLTSPVDQCFEEFRAEGDSGGELCKRLSWLEGESFGGLCPWWLYRILSLPILFPSPHLYEQLCFTVCSLHVETLPNSAKKQQS